MTSPPDQVYAGLRYRSDPKVYDPHDDTWLLVDAVRALQWDGRCVLEVGCGAGLAVIAAVQAGAALGVGSDRNRTAVRLLATNAALNGVHRSVAGVTADLVGPFEVAAFDRVLFNPPYLPHDPGLPVSGELAAAVEGGPTGDAVIDRFLGGLEAFSRRGRRVPETLLVLSDRNDGDMVRRRMARLGLARVEVMGSKRYFFDGIRVERYRQRDGPPSPHVP